MIEKYKQRFCVVCDDRPAIWAIEQAPGNAEFTCNIHLSKRLRELAAYTERVFRVLTIEYYFVQFCLDCRRDVKALNELYMVFDSVWYEVNETHKGMLCVGCFETRLGRKLVPGDFTHCPLNTDFKNKSTRLSNRLGHHLKHENRDI